MALAKLREPQVMDQAINKSDERVSKVAWMKGENGAEGMNGGRESSRHERVQIL